ncbi:MAG: tetratricopeptide repeat protein [Lysobacteraceae bacterium]
MKRFRHRHDFVSSSVIFLMALLAATWMVYAPGLHGGFLFDDFGNLPAIGATGQVDTWPAFWRYVTSGIADPTGRPLALLSFLIDAQDWPADPYPFKSTNLVLHLLNGVFLALLLRQLGRALTRFRRDPIAGDAATELLPAPRERNQTLRIDLAAALGAGLWLLHPLFVSTTLYIVQREAMLPASFTLLGLLLWLHGRALMLSGHAKGGAVWIALGLGGCTLLAVLSKANGMLLPALALLIEYILLRPADAAIERADRDRNTISRVSLAAPVTAHVAATRDDSLRMETSSTSAARATAPRAYRGLMHALSWPPTIAAAAYLIYAGWHGAFEGIGSLRPWTLGQRLLTEPRVLMDYLGLLWLPRPFTPGLFNDQIRASTSFLIPLTTLPAILGVVALIAGAIFLRRRWPALALAVLFYFVGQSIESTTIPLELYFEHRNYLPAALMFWPLALWLCGVTQHATAHRTVPTRSFSHAKTAMAAVLLVGLGTMTFVRSTLWGNTLDQSLLWATLNPESSRAQANAAQVEMSAGHPARAVARLRPMVAKQPAEVQLAFNLVGAQCQSGHVDAATLAAADAALRTTRNPGALAAWWFDRVITQVDHPACPELTLDQLQTWIDAANENPRIADAPGRRQDFLRLEGRIALARGDVDTALADFNRSLDQDVRAGAALEQAALLGSAGFPRQGIAHLDHYAAERTREQKPAFGMPRIHAWVLSRQGYWAHELTHLRATLSADMQEVDRPTQ